MVRLEGVLKLSKADDGLAELKSTEHSGPRVLVWHDEVGHDIGVAADHVEGVQRAHHLLEGHVDELPRIAPVESDLVKLGLALGKVLHLKPSVSDARHDLAQSHARQVLRPVVRRGDRELALEASVVLIFPPGHVQVVDVVRNVAVEGGELEWGQLQALLDRRGDYEFLLLDAVEVSVQALVEHERLDDVTEHPIAAKVVVAPWNELVPGALDDALVWCPPLHNAN
mmetsp:Transcript_16478/g.38227  ORF Transcript_16478/g.38227 Transcript_16478/m.38227 type:complete len:226 (+) Transcript_16478:700-1377(+)